jgi:hypothetical protein
MPALIIEFAAFVTSHLLMVWIGANYKPIRDFLRRMSSSPKVDSFKREMTESEEGGRYERYPKRRPLYFIREHAEHRTASLDPTYHFFIRKGINIEEFMAFLLPSLDFGHGSRVQSARNGSRLEFNAEWDEYLIEIGERIKKVKKEYSGEAIGKIKKQRLREAEDIPLWSRIVFFRKHVLVLFLLHHEQLNAWARNESLSERALKQFADGIINYAFDIAMIHERMQDYKEEIDCRYIAESAVPASDCYDFGVYKVEGIHIAYVPVQLNDGDMRIKKEKVYIGTTRRQRQGIREHILTYCSLWQAAERQCHRNETHLNHMTPKELDDPRCEKFGYDHLTRESFDLIYGRALAQILTSEFDATFPEKQESINKSRLVVERNE